MGMNGKRDIGPVLLKYGVALALSLGGILYSFLVNKRLKASQSPPDPRRRSDCSNQVNTGMASDHQTSHTAPTSLHFDPLTTDKHEELRHSNIPVPDLSPSSRSNGDKDAYLLPEFNELVKDVNMADMKANVSPMKDTKLLQPDIEGYSHAEKDTHEKEIKSLRHLVKILKERESNLEIQLLEYYGLKEQGTAVMELHNRLKVDHMEVKLFGLKIESLQADNRRLEAQMTDYTKAVVDLEAARGKIKVLKKKLRSEAEQDKKQILDLQRRVQKLQQEEHKHMAEIDQEMGSSYDKLKGLEVEVEELRKTNRSLQLEKSDLARRLDCVQILATSVIEDGETKKLKEESRNLKKQNEDLSKEIERLQADRYCDLEELVYLKWINACLRYELRNHQPGPGKTMARDLSKTLSPGSEEKAKQLILEYANREGIPEIDSKCCQASVITDSMELDESCIDDPSPRKSSNKFFGRLMRVLIGKDYHHHHHRNYSRNSSLGRSDDMNFCSDSRLGSSSENHMLRTSSCVDSERLITHRHSDADACFYKQVDSIAEGGGGKKSELLKYAEALN